MSKSVVLVLNGTAGEVAAYFEELSARYGDQTSVVEALAMEKESENPQYVH